MYHSKFYWLDLFLFSCALLLKIPGSEDFITKDILKHVHEHSTLVLKLILVGKDTNNLKEKQQSLKEKLYGLASVPNSDNKDVISDLLRPDDHADLLDDSDGEGKQAGRMVNRVVTGGEVTEVGRERERHQLKVCLTR